MRHFLGGFAVGFLFARWKIEAHKSVTQMSNYEFGAFLLAHAIIASFFGIAAWGLLP